jgi:hypothetical protein
MIAYAIARTQPSDLNAYAFLNAVLLAAVLLVLTVNLRDGSQQGLRLGCARVQLLGRELLWCELTLVIRRAQAIGRGGWDPWRGEAFARLRWGWSWVSIGSYWVRCHLCHTRETSDRFSHCPED